MKKIIPNFKTITLRVLLTCCLGFFVMFFSSCSKEKKLDGTIWVGTYDDIVRSSEDYTVEHKFNITLAFMDNSIDVYLKLNYILTGEGGVEKGIESDFYTMTYTCDKNKITFVEGNNTWIGSIDKEMTSITFVGGIFEDWGILEPIIFIKQ